MSSLFWYNLRWVDENRNSFITSGGRQAALSRYILYPSMPHISFLSLAINLNRSVFHATTFESSAEAYEGGSPPPWGGGSFCLHFPSSGNLHSTLHCITLDHRNYKIKKRNKICSDSQQYPSNLFLIKYCIKHPCFPFWKLNIFICGFSTKVTRAFLSSETMEKWRFQRYIGHATQ